MELSDNNLSGAELANLPKYENLQQIRLSNNRKINSFEDLKNLAKFQNLFLLELEECPISKLENYREKVFEMLPNLAYLDSISKNGDVLNNGKKIIFKFFLFLDSEEDEEGEDEGDEEFISKEDEELEEGEHEELLEEEEEEELEEEGN